jgi:hypothetical protein
MSKLSHLPATLGSAALLLALFVEVGCKSSTELSGPEGFQEWEQNALAHPGKNPAAVRFRAAYHGDPAALRQYFAEALRLAQSNAIQVEAGQSLAYELKSIIDKIGDQKFAGVLRGETPETRSAVAISVSQAAFGDYPETIALLKSAPKVDFPLLRVSRGDYPGGRQPVEGAAPGGSAPASETPLGPSGDITPAQ